MSQEKQDLKAQVQAKPGKVVFLGVLVVGALWSWSGVVMGGSDQAAATPPPAQSRTGTAPAPIPGAPAAPSPLGQIASFQAAMDRLAVWQDALEPDDLVPDSAISVPATLEEANPFASEALDQLPAPAPVAVVEEVEELPLLTGTVLFGDSRFAIFEGHRVQEGGRIGRYVVASIRPREVDLRDRDQVLTLKIRKPNLSR